jgi:hypothetical protein
MGRLLRTELSSINGPPIERCLALQLLISCFSNRSSTRSQSAFNSFLKWIGIFKYLRGNSPSLQLNNSVYWAIEYFASPKQNISLLWKFILRPESCLNAQSNNFIFQAFSRSCSIKSIVLHYKKLFNLWRILRDVFRKRHECALQPKTLRQFL